MQSLQASHLPPKTTHRMDTAIPRLTSFVTDGTYKATLGHRGEIVERKHGDVTRFMVCVEVARQPPHLISCFGFRRWRTVTFTLREETTRQNLANDLHCYKQSRTDIEKVSLALLCPNLMKSFVFLVTSLLMVSLFAALCEQRSIVSLHLTSLQ